MEGVTPVKKPRRMLQPRKDYIRAELKLAEAEIKSLTAEIERLRTPWWVRAWRKIA
jgi:hypothetical protein